MLVLIIVTLFVATLSGLGVGSAGLLVIWLSLVEKMPQLTAQGLNLVFFLFSSGSALIVHLFSASLPYACILFLICTGLLGSALGTALAAVLAEALLRRLFGMFLIISGAFGLFSQLKNKKK